MRTSHQNEVPGFAPGILDRLYSTGYRDIAFSQVFYPTRGILAWYDRKEKTMRPLPGADDPRFVQTSAFWSPDGRYLIFSRAEARDPYPAGAPKPLHANDPNETQIQYDLYKIPFNEGRGGKAVPVEGASGNGMSNDFPKVSPDGRWIVFVQNKNGLLMRPDSRLFIVPFDGRQGAPDELQSVADELVAYIFPKWAMACVFIEGARALYAANADAHRRKRQRHARDHRGQHHRCQSRGEHPRVCEHAVGRHREDRPPGHRVLPDVR